MSFFFKIDSLLSAKYNFWYQFGAFFLQKFYFKFWDVNLTFQNKNLALLSSELYIYLSMYLHWTWLKNFKMVIDVCPNYENIHTWCEKFQKENIDSWCEKFQNKFELQIWIWIRYITISIGISWALGTMDAMDHQEWALSKII